MLGRHRPLPLDLRVGGPFGWTTGRVAPLPCEPGIVARAVLSDRGEPGRAADRGQEPDEVGPLALWIGGPAPEVDVHLGVRLHGATVVSQLSLIRALVAAGLRPGV